jgi:predicted transposase YbfD/YdcC
MDRISLVEAFAEVSDPRSAHGLRHPLSAVLSLVVVALLGGARSLEAIVQFGRDRGTTFAHALGFRRGKTPAKSTLSVLLRRIDAVEFETVLSRWITPRLGEAADELALDGKTLCGSASGDLPGVHLISLYATKVHATLAQLRVDAKTNEHKAVLQLLGVLPLAGAVVTGDAMFCHRDVCQEVLDQNGDYLLFVKDNQPTLAQDIAAGFETPAALSPSATAVARPRAATRSHRGEKLRPHRTPRVGIDHGVEPLPGLAGSRTGISLEA